MARGIIQLPLESGKKELNWYVGKASVAATTETNPVVAMRINRDADFVARRLWLVQYPNTVLIGSPAAANYQLPLGTSVILRDGGTQRGLSLVGGFNRAMLNDCAPERALLADRGLPSPFLIRNNNNLFAEISNPAAAVTPWVGDLYLVAEGYKVYPGVAEDIPRTIEAYSIPFNLNTNFVAADPAAAAANITQQVATITNNGEGKFLAKGLVIQAIDNAGVDRTTDISAALAFNFADSTSGTKSWVQNQNPTADIVGCPFNIMTINGSNLPFNTPRLLDENAVIKMQFVFSSLATAYLSAAATWPVTFSVSLYGSLLPR